MSEDAKNSIFLAAGVTALFLFTYVFMQLTKGVHFPRWIGFAGLGVQAINLLFWLSRARRRKRHRNSSI